ncbi:hypothetical protein [Endozoicomonas numazuensis]|uniref:hypothetical protein n=1 Tax=Endozoicomonas numazuensis TaxID=1137799 RepID=UPI0012678FDD|nr:hypothetical protein [Endozoicomonas numazuensis]
MPDKLLDGLNPRSNFLLLIADFLAVILPPLLNNLYQQEQTEEANEPLITHASLHIYYTQQEGQAAHFFLAETSIHDQLHISNLTQSMLEDPWLQEQLNQQADSHTLPTKAERDAELMQLQFMAANASGSYRRILLDLITVLIADDLGEFGRLPTPDEMEQIRRENIHANHIDYLTRRYLRIQEGRDGYSIAAIDPEHPLSETQQIRVETFPSLQTLLSTTLEMMEARNLADQMNNLLSTEPQPSPEPSDADKDESKTQPLSSNSKEDKKSDAAKPPEKQKKDEEDARRQEHPQDTPPPPVSGATHVVTDGAQKTFRNRPQTYEMARLLMGVTPNHDIYRTLRSYLINDIELKDLSTFIDSCYDAIHLSIRESPFSFKVPAQTLIMFTTLKRMREDYLNWVEKQKSDLSSQDFKRQLELAQIQLLKQLIDYTVFEDRPGLLVTQLAKTLPTATFDQILDVLKNSQTRPGRHSSAADTVGYRDHDQLEQNGVTVFITDVGTSPVPVRCLVRQHDKVMVCSSDIPVTSSEPAAAKPNPRDETLGSSLQNTLQHSGDLRVLTHPESSFAMTGEATIEQTERQKKIQGQIARDLVRSNLFFSVTVGKETIVFYDNKQAIASIRSHLIDMTPAGSKPLTRKRSKSFRSRTRPKASPTDIDTSMDGVVQYRLIQGFLDYVDLYLSANPALAQSIAFASTQALGNDAYTFIMKNLERGMEHAVASQGDVRLLLNRAIGSTETDFIYESPFPEFAPPPWTTGDVVSKKRPSIGGLWIMGQFVQGANNVWRATGLSWIYDIQEDNIDLMQTLDITDGQPHFPDSPLMTWEQALATLSRINSNEHNPSEHSSSMHTPSERSSVFLESDSPPGLFRSMSDTALDEATGRYHSREPGSRIPSNYPATVVNPISATNLRRAPVRDLSAERDTPTPYTIDPFMDTNPSLSLLPQLPGAVFPLLHSSSTIPNHERSYSDPLISESSSSNSKGDSIGRDIQEP